MFPYESLEASQEIITVSLSIQ